MKTLSKIYLKIIGWRIKGSFPKDLKKCVIIAAPHTSMTDFLIGRAAFYMFGVKKINFLIKKEMFRFPLGGIIRAMGALPVDRSKSSNMLLSMTKMFREKEKVLLIITPEGTRKYSENWKRGFYHIAENAGVPIVLSYVNYGLKEGGIGPIIYPTGNYDEDLKVIQEFYKDKIAKYPENFNLSARYRK